MSLASVRGIHRGPVNSPHKWPVTQKMFSFDDVIMRGANFGANTDPSFQHIGLMGIFHNISSKIPRQCIWSIYVSLEPYVLFCWISHRTWTVTQWYTQHGSDNLMFHQLSNKVLYFIFPENIMAINWHFIIHSWDFLLGSMKYAITGFTKMKCKSIAFQTFTYSDQTISHLIIYGLQILSMNKKCCVVNKQMNFYPTHNIYNSMTYMINSRGPRTEPSGTPYSLVEIYDVVLLQETYCLRLLK